MTHGRRRQIQTLNEVFKQHPTSHWLKVLEPLGLPFAPVNNIKETFEHPQVKARRMVEEVDHPRAGKIKLVGVPVKYGHTKPSIRLPPPTLGQHTTEVLQDVLGYEDSRVMELRKDGVI
ncbi:hypothetical protein HDV00_004130 [Rhizophlyctis rosea]|nr:hypothetical protein HDV00_004130 [Rhizophlyctis rosea]